MSAFYKGNPVESVDYDQRSETYRLLNADDEVVAELKRHEFLSLPSIKMLRHTNGRHRRARPAVYSRSAGKPYFTWNPRTPTLVSWTFIGTDWAEPKPIENAGIRAGEIVAHRGWRVEDGHLVSIYKRQHVWRPGEPMTGDVRHEYGVHAFKTAELVEDYADLADGPWHGWVRLTLNDAGKVVVEDQPAASIFAFGHVAMWGEVIEHERGYRAEFGKVHSIDRISSNDTEALAKLRARYGVESAQALG